MKSLSEAEVWEFFDSRPGWAALTSLGADGFPHTVAIGYFRLDKTIYCGCRDHTQKVRNLEAEPKASLMIESGRDSGSLKGVTFQALASVVRDPEEIRHLKREPKSGIAYIKLEPVKILSWVR